MDNGVTSITHMTDSTVFSNGEDKHIAFNVSLKIFLAWCNTGEVYMFDSDVAEEMIDETLEYFENQYPFACAEKFTVEYMHHVAKTKINLYRG